MAIKLHITNFFKEQADSILKTFKNLTIKAPITTAADDKFCNIFPNYQKKSQVS